MSVKFVIDSASDILPQEAAALGITVLPLTVIFNGSTYRDAIDLSHREFFEKLACCKELPTTSQLPRQTLPTALRLSLPRVMMWW